MIAVISQKLSLLYSKSGKTMKPKPTVRTPQRELFRVELVSLVDLAHPLVKLGEKMNWQVFDQHLTFDGKTGAPRINTRLMVALHYLMY